MHTRKPIKAKYLLMTAFDFLVYYSRIELILFPGMKLKAFPIKPCRLFSEKTFRLFGKTKSYHKTYRKCLYFQNILNPMVLEYFGICVKMKSHSPDSLVPCYITSHTLYTMKIFDQSKISSRLGRSISRLADAKFTEMRSF